MVVEWEVMTMNELIHRRVASFIACLFAFGAVAGGGVNRVEAQTAVAESQLRALGDTGGQAFTERPGNGARLVGMKVSGGAQSSTKIVAACEPIFRAGDGTVTSTRYGEGLDFVSAEARPGYVVGAIVGQAGPQVSGFRLIFMRETAGRVDPADSYPSRWLGRRSAQPEVYIYGGGRPIIAVTAHLQGTLIGLGFTFAGDLGTEPSKNMQIGLADAAAQLEKSGVRLTRAEDRPGKPIVKADFSGMQLEKADLALLAALADLETLDLTSTFSTTDLDLSPLGGLKKLREIDLTDCHPLGPASFLRLGKLTELRSLKVPTASTVDDDKLGALAGLVNLETFVGGGSEVTDRGVEHLAALPKLQSLSLDNTKIGDAGVLALAKTPQLKHLSMRGSLLTDAGLKTLATFPQLESIEILNSPRPQRWYEARMTGDGLRELAKLPQLKKLAVSGQDITVDDKAIGFIVQMKDLEHLTIYATGITDAGLRIIGTLRKLQVLSIENNEALTDAGLAHLVRLSTLKELWLNGAPITGEGLKHVARLENLERLHLNGTKVDDDALEQIAELRQLKQLTLIQTPVTGRGLKHLKNLTKLEILDLTRSPITAAPWEELSGLNELRAISLRGTKIGDGDLDGLKHLRGLRRLLLSGTKVGDRGIGTLAEFAELEALELASTSVGDEGAASAARIKGMKNLDLSGTRVTDDGLKAIGTMTQLTRLLLSGNRLTDQGVAALGGCTKLIRVYLQCDRVTREGTKKLKQALPHAAIYGSSGVASP